jgi:flagellar basal-body rod modification protein FlgD
MAAFAAGIFSHVTAATQTLSSPTSNSSPTSAALASDGTSISSASSATISANDFLTLLVTEMKNQDPTANTDPNEYINHLVNVNSLEQLININQNLSNALGNPGANANVSGPQLMPAANSPQSNAATHRGIGSLTAQSSPAVSGGAPNFDVLAAALKHAPGNLTVPKAVPAAQSLAHALGGNSRAQSTAIGPR